MKEEIREGETDYQGVTRLVDRNERGKALDRPMEGFIYKKV